MRDRLIEMITDIENNLTQTYPYTTDEYRIKETADYLLANGVIVPPCKMGTRVYRLVPDLSVIWPDSTEYKIVWDTFRLSDIYSFGKTVFLTREDAEKAFKGGTEE